MTEVICQVSWNSCLSLTLVEIYYSSLNEYYRPAVDISRFVLSNFSWTLKLGSFDAPTFLLYMPKIYEDFIVNALRESKPLQSLGANMKSFQQNKSLRFDTSGNIEIKPDFTFWDHNDCRYVLSAIVLTSQICRGL
jgi:5-methylcytosine-specific restriction endonuclease McrBC regulatory subunit McrC